MAELILQSGDCLYKVLGVDRAASDEEIKRAYKKLALKHHPDRAGAAGADEFKKINFAHSVLKDKEKRRFYDETGHWDLHDDDAAGNIQAFMSNMFQKFSKEKFMQGLNSYRNSEQELDDLAQAYKESGGDCLDTLQRVYFNDSQPEEEDRLVGRVQEMINAGRLESTPKWEETKITEATKETPEYKRRWAKRLKEAEEFQKEQDALKGPKGKKKKKKGAAGACGEEKLSRDELLRLALQEVMANEGAKMVAQEIRKRKKGKKVKRVVVKKVKRKAPKAVPSEDSPAPDAALNGNGNGNSGHCCDHANGTTGTSNGKPALKKMAAKKAKKSAAKQ